MGSVRLSPHHSLWQYFQWHPFNTELRTCRCSSASSAIQIRKASKSAYRADITSSSHAAQSSVGPPCPPNPAPGTAPVPPSPASALVPPAAPPTPPPPSPTLPPSAAPPATSPAASAGLPLLHASVRNTDARCVSRHSHPLINSASGDSELSKSPPTLLPTPPAPPPTPPPMPPPTPPPMPPFALSTCLTDPSCQTVLTSTASTCHIRKPQVDQVKWFMRACCC